MEVPWNLNFFFPMMKKIWLPKLQNQELVTHATFSLSLSDLLIRLWPHQWSSVNSQLPWAVACWHWHPQWTWVCRCLLSSTKLTNLTMVWWSDLLLLRALCRGYLGWRWRHHVLASWTWVMCGGFFFFFFLNLWLPGLLSWLSEFLLSLWWCFWEGQGASFFTCNAILVKIGVEL